MRWECKAKGCFIEIFLQDITDKLAGETAHRQTK